MANGIPAFYYDLVSPYAWLAAGYTTTTLTAEEIHELGKQELVRIEGELAKLAAGEACQDFGILCGILRRPAVEQ